MSLTHNQIEDLKLIAKIIGTAAVIIIPCVIALILMGASC